MMKSFELMKSDKVTEQSDSWFPARSADLLVACSLSHTVPKWYSGATVATWYSGAAQCYSATPLILSNRSIPPSARGALYIAAVLRINFLPLFQIHLTNRFPRWVSSRARGRWTSQAPQRREATLRQRWMTALTKNPLQEPWPRIVSVALSEKM